MRLHVTDMGQVQRNSVSYWQQPLPYSQMISIMLLEGGPQGVWSLNKKKQVLVTNDRQDEHELFKRIIERLY